MELAEQECERLEQELAHIPRRPEELRKSGLERRSRTDADSRFLKERKGFVLGYTMTLAASQDKLIVEQRVTQETTDHAALMPMVEGVQQWCGETPAQVSADSDFFALSPLHELEKQGVDAYVPDSNLARVLNRGGRLRGRAKHPVHRRMRRKLRCRKGRMIYGKRKTLIEPIFGVLKEQRGMRQFRRRGLANVAVEVSLATTAYNLTRLWNVLARAGQSG